MDAITHRDFIISQPSFPEPTETDVFYVDVANRLAAGVAHGSLVRSMPDGLVKRISLTLTDYLEDIVSDAGLWRSFVNANRQLYGFSVPFHDIPETYVDFELNREDVRFLVWYVIAMLWEDRRLISPHDPGLIEYADICFDILESIYEDAPVPESFNISRGLEFNDPEDRDKIYSLGNWLFLHSYLLTPAFSMSLREMASEFDPADPDYSSKFNKRLEESMMQDTTGPLALFTPEWVYLMIEGKLPAGPKSGTGNVHKYYEAFTIATGGKIVKFFSDYESMNEFFISALGWEPGVEHLSQAKGQHDYVLMVNREKGMLMAVNVARCIKAPDNPVYDESYARDNAMTLLTDRGRCPGDLLRLIFDNDWLPDAHFPDSDDFRLVHDNRDFIARTFLQIYYRGD